MMRRISANGGHHLLLLLLLVIHSIHAQAVASRLLRPVPNLGDLKIIEGLQAEVLPEEDSWKLTGMEECKEGNEECEKRRMMYEAHLDYIYTQHRRKP